MGMGKVGNSLVAVTVFSLLLISIQGVSAITTGPVLEISNIVGDGVTQIITVTTTVAHDLSTGDLVNIQDTTNFDIIGATITVTGATTFTYDLGSVGSATPETVDVFVVSPLEPCPAPPILDADMRCWTEESYPSIPGVPGSAHWAVANDGSIVEQVDNGQPTFFYSPFTAFHKEITITNEVLDFGRPGPNFDDDDFIGFAIGFEPGDSTDTGADYLLLDWKRLDQNFDFDTIPGQPNTPGGDGDAVLALSRVTGIPTPDELWQHVDYDTGGEPEGEIGGVTEIERVTSGLGSAGWERNVPYTFVISLSPDVIVVSLDDGSGPIEVFNITAESVLGPGMTWDDGRVAFYNFSQDPTRYSGTAVVPLPIAEAGSDTVEFETLETLTLTGNNPDNIALISFDIDTPPTKGVLGPISTPPSCIGLSPIICDVTVDYTPNPGEFGSDQFTFTVTDGPLTSLPAPFDITINPPTGTITVEKNTEPDVDVDFDFTIFEGTTIIPDFTLCDNGVIGCTSLNPSTSDTFTVEADSYTISETESSGFEVTSIVCDFPGNVDPPLTITDASSIFLAVDDEEDWTCIFTNEPIPEQSIKVIKEADPEIDADFAFVIDETSEAFFVSFNLCDFTSPCTSGEDEISDTYDVPVGEYRIAEGDIPSGYSVSSITCDLEGFDEEESNVDSSTITFDVEAGEQWTCTFVNDLTIPTADYGDAPDSYSTLFVSDGPHHLTDPGQTLGSIIDTENDGVPTSDALGDDMADTDDEDGITLPAFFTPGTDADITINIQGIEEGASASVTGFIDFNRNGVFDDPSERVVEITRDINGDHVVPVSVPAIASAGDTYARFRIVEGISNYLPPTGAAPNGEVEDYTTSIELVPCPEGPTGDDSTAGFLLGLLVPDMYRAFGGTPPPTSEPCADLSISKLDDINKIPIGDTLTYTITVDNSAGPDDSELVVVEDELPSGVTFVSATPDQGTCGEAGGIVTCDLGTIGNGDVVDIVIEVIVGFGVSDPIVNTATVSAETFDNNDANNIATENTNPCIDEESGDDSGPVRFLLGLLVPEHLMAFGGGPSYPPCTIPRDDGNGGLPYPDPNLGDPKHGQGHSNGFCMNQTCMDVTGLFNHWPETNVPQGSTQSFTLLVSCPRGAQTCNHIALAGALPDADFYDDRWTVTLQKQPMTDIWDISVMNDYGEIDEAGVTATVQPVSQTMITSTINVPFVIPGSIGTADGTDPAHENNRHLHVTVHDNHAGSSNYIFNEGMYVEDIYAYPQIETRFDAPLVYEQLCINEDEKDRRTCAFELVRQWTIEQAEEKLKELYDQKGQDMDSYDESEQN